MIRGIGRLEIDQTPCRASYGLLTPSALRRDMYNRQKANVMEGIAATAAKGDRMAKAWIKANHVEEIAADAYGYHPLDVGVVYIDRPVMNYTPDTGGNVDIAI